MRTFLKDERMPSRLARERGDAPPLLTVEEQLDGVKLELMRPIEVDGEEITEVEIQAPTPDDILDGRMGDGQSKDAVYRGLSKATNLSVESLRILHGRDFQRLETLYWGFIE